MKSLAGRLPGSSPDHATRNSATLRGGARSQWERPTARCTASNESVSGQFPPGRNNHLWKNSERRRSLRAGMPICKPTIIIRLEEFLVASTPRASIAMTCARGNSCGSGTSDRHLIDKERGCIPLSDREDHAHQPPSLDHSYPATKEKRDLPFACRLVIAMLCFFLLSFVSRLQVVLRCSISLYACEIAARNTVSGAVFKEVAMQIVGHNELRARSSPSNVRR